MSGLSLLVAAVFGLAHGPLAPAGPPVERPVAILEYHVIATPPPGTPYPLLWTPWHAFEAQMRALRAHGFQGITLWRAWEAWHGRATLPRHPVVLSFDDGYQSQKLHAARTLAALGWPGTLNLQVGTLGPGGLSRAQVRALVLAGWELDAHTFTHPDLTTVDAARLRHEVGGSRAWLRRVFDQPVRFFCYPAGRYDARVEAAVRAAGFDGATTERPGLASPREDPDALPRIEVLGGTSPTALLAEMRSLGA